MSLLASSGALAHDHNEPAANNDAASQNQTAPAVPNLTMQQVEETVKNYIDSNPDVVYKALVKYRNQEMAKQEQLTKDSVIKNYTALFDSNSPSFGSPSAKVTVVEFMDYDCGHCKIVGPRLTALAQSGQLRVIVKHLPIRGNNSLYSSEMALAANKQGKFEAVYEAFLKAKDLSSEEKINEVAVKAGVDLAKAKADMSSFKQEIDENFRLASKMKLQGTPSLVFSNGNPKTAVFVPGAVNEETLKSIIKDLNG